MRVLLIHNFYQQRGGEDAAVEAEQALLARAGVEVQLYSRHNDEMRHYGVGEKLLFPLHALASPRTADELPPLLQEFRPDVAYLHNLFPLLSPTVYGTLHAAGVPIVQAIHNYRLFCVNGCLYRDGAVCEECLGGSPWPAIRHGCQRDSRVISAIYAAAQQRTRRSAWQQVDTFVCLTPFSRDKLIEAGLPAGRIRVRPNAIDTSAVTPSFTPGEYALYLGRLSPEKGVRTLVRAFLDTPSRPLVIAGAGPLEDELKQLAAGAPHIHFAGFLTGAAKRETVRQSRFVVIPSECYENFPLAALEAYAAGKPVLGSRLGSIPYVVPPNETGRLFTAGDADDLKHEVAALWNTPFEISRLGRAARRRAETQYDSSGSIRQLLDILASAAGTGVDAPALPMAAGRR